MKRIFFALAIILMTGMASGVWAGMSSTNYLINWDSLNQGGSDVGTSTNYVIHDTVGESLAGTTGTSANYGNIAGYRSAEASSTLSLIIRSQNTATQIAYTAFSNGGKTVTVNATSSYSVGDFIAAVENLGFSQRVTVGRVTDITGAVMTVDRWDGANAWMSAVPAGGDDFVYNLSNNSAAFGTLSVGTANVSVTMTSVQSSVASGYSVYLQANQNLQNASAQQITEVTDGSVTVGVEEYGASATGTRAFLPDTDYGVTSTQRVIQTSPALAFPTADRVAMTYKLSITALTNPGAYSQNVYYTLTANY